MHPFVRTIPLLAKRALFRALKLRLRTILSVLRATLSEVCMKDVLIRERRQVAIRRYLVDCDYGHISIRPPHEGWDFFMRSQIKDVDTSIYPSRAGWDQR